MAKKIDIYLGAATLLTCLGDLEETMSCMDRNISGLKHHAEYGMITGTLDRIIPCKKGHTLFESLVIDRLEQIEKLSGVRIADPNTILILSTTKGNVNLLAGSGYQPVPEKAFLYNSAITISKHFGCLNRPIVISNACISGVSAFILAYRILMQNKYTNAVIAGCDLLSEFITAGFASFKSISTQPCRPYDTRHNGLNLGEGCGAIILTTEPKYAIRPLVYLTGGCITNDANHLSAPSRTGEGLYLAIQGALCEAGLSPDDIGFINAHGTATIYNDEMECEAIMRSGLKAVPVNSLKGYIGHTLGASGVIESILCANQLRQKLIYGTKGFLSQDSLGLKISSDRQTFIKHSCIKTASGFGGCNAAIVLSMKSAPENCGHSNLRKRNVRILAEYSLPQSETPFCEFIRNEFTGFKEPYMKFYKMSDMSKAIYIAVEHLLKNFDLSSYIPARRAIVMANKASSIDADIVHQKILDQKMPTGASPATFVYTLPNVAIGEICIKHQFKGENIFFIEDKDSGLAMDYASHLIATNIADIAICGWCDFLFGKWDIKIKLLSI